MSYTVTFTKNGFIQYKELVKRNKDADQKTFVHKGQLETVKHAEWLIRKLEASPNLSITI
jgi:hypothetical protein